MMRPGLGLVALALTVTTATMPARRAFADDAAVGRPISVRVVEIAGGRAFLTPGEDAGLRRGVRVLLRKRGFVVVEATGKNAVIVVGDAALAENDRGTALVTPPSASAARRLPAPAPLWHFAGKWPDAAPPADRQTPRPVPLGPGAGASEPLRLTLSAHLVATAAPAGHPGELALGAELSVAPWRELPFGVDADASAYAWWGPDAGPAGAEAGATQVPLRVRELRLRYGGDADPFAALGRLRWAGRGVGLLDGLRVRVPLGAGLSLAGFGGFVPDPVSGAPARDASRFGVAASWDRPGWAARPHLDATVSGSIFDGALDQRRIDVGAALSPGPLALAGRGQISLFPSPNPWHARTVELTAAGLDASLRGPRAHAGLHVDLRQPERSRYLESLLPAGWSCVATPGPPGTAETERCDGRRRLRLSGALDAGFQFGPLALSAGASATAPEGDEDAALGVHGDLRLVGPGEDGRVALGATLLSGGFVDLRALRVELGARVLGGRVDGSMFYRLSAIRYVAALGGFVQHSGGFDVAWTVSPEVDLAWTVEAEVGPDLRVITALATAVWRPFP